MATFSDHETSEFLPMTRPRSTSSASQTSSDSGLSSEPAFQEDQKQPFSAPNGTTGMDNGDRYRDLEDGEAEANEPFLASSKKAATGGRARRIFWLLVLLCFGGWLLAFVLFLTGGRANYQSASDALQAQEPESASGSTSSGKPVTLEQVLTGQWSPRYHAITWVAGPNDEDGLLVEKGGGEQEGYLRVDDIQSRKNKDGKGGRVLMRKPIVHVDGKLVVPGNAWPSPDLKKVLLISDQEKNWRHSFTGKYWVLDVESQTAQPLDPSLPDGRVQLALWSPKSDAVIFVRENDVYLRKLSSDRVVTVTKDGGENLFYGVPDWVYEEEVISGRSVTWWSNDAKYVAFFRTNESAVSDFPVDYFLSRPSGKKPDPGLENYPEVRQIKYPKAGASNPVVDLQFYDVEKNEVFSVDVADDFDNDDRIIIEVVWASEGKVLVRSTNRESDILKVFLIDTKSRTGRVVRTEDVASLDGGWVEPSQSTRFIPADPSNGRPDDGYIDTVPYKGYDHLAYFSPLDSPKGVMLTSGDWEVVDAPAAVDLQRGLVYFVAAKEAPTERHIYRVQLDGSNMTAITDTSKPGYFGVSFSHGAGYALLTYNGPSVPWQAIINTHGDEITFEERIEENPQLTSMIEAYALPTEIYQNVTVDGFTLQVVERRPPHFNPAKKYPVLFYLYGGPGSQTVDRKFSIDFQSYVASSLGYIVVTVDGRGTGHIGRKARCIVRGNLGFYEARDQIATAKIWAAKSYVDESRMAIWGWSFGGFMTLKTLELDAGETFQYGMAVAPVTDWRFYDSIYSERYMHTPQHNPSGYANSTITDMAALTHPVRFLVMHGTADDNVHLQNTLVLTDKLDLSNVKNYDLHFFPDSDHSIFFHNAHAMVYDRLSSWLVNAFNGEWHRIAHPVPGESMWTRFKRSLPVLV
ncbi:dipeptidyl aminopeptidase dapB [Aspergillus clavatus NRRL 1]|uniref:Probable dipeptidyl-aminopeptidase B n=1 Tax=Aspergillus clavatus (strain ATCC 1007 / CBS 513.65 / DSM 816 / NCTC 3887 / NRRL 1 / QM 1276 / 107) TaxID=344612 RepID=DAPB_ASPCL|nr:pheromone maturation dipeptidyl aminopeptidase DapB [Aspergillus clavatus NRRL 1]A1CJQ1.1 RecName: Full=Probable dipeptidyl-aminopeptidase B; Short=DPAP B [Aspergillus clavatus NRRL 1]EAW09375.1 pheromone maturation dipeptidyl aminopeptidase DapB [Aspergillus clavatus NRRL 1]